MPADYNPIPAKKLRARYWMLSHVSQAHALGVYTFVLFDAIVVVMALWFAVHLYGIELLSYPRGLRAMAQPLHTANVASQLVEPLHTIEVGSVPTTGDRSDLYALIANPNTHFMARFTYSFAGGNEIRTQEAFIYPGEQKYVLEMGSSYNGGSADSLQLQIKDVHWTRISSVGLKEIKERTQLVVKDFSFVPGSGSIPFSRLTFTVYNPTGYNFAHVALPVVLRYGGNVVALNYTIIDKVMAAETRTGDVRWFVSTGPVDGYVVEPSIDIYNPSTFLTPQGEPLTPSPNDD